MSTQIDTGRIPKWTRGDRMRKAMDTAGLSVADMANYHDVSRNTVGNWLNDRTRPTRSVLMVWALRTGVPFGWLETGADVMDVTSKKNKTAAPASRAHGHVAGTTLPTMDTHRSLDRAQRVRNDYRPAA